jgi:hypothetical protein
MPGNSRLWGFNVPEDRLHQIANALWVLSSFLTMRGNSAVTRLAQGWMLAGVLALDWSGLGMGASQERFARVAHPAPGCFQELGAELALAV